jgi:hypothetical protein
MMPGALRDFAIAELEVPHVPLLWPVYRRYPVIGAPRFEQPVCEL